MEFDEIQKFALQEYKINLEAYKSKQLTRRIESFMKRTGSESQRQFVELLRNDSKIKKKFMDYLTINVSEFYRNKSMFLELKRQIIDKLQPEKKTLKIWSAACSNGSEPYTLSMIMDEITPFKSHNIIATDIDVTILETAQKGIYTQNDIKNVEDYEVKKYFTKNDDKYEICSKIKQNVKFKRHDLIMDSYDSGFDLIVCRNVVIYFTQEAKDKIYKKFYNALNPGALLFVGATESIYNYKEIGFEKASTFIYRKPGGN